jgi:hypothetical protein
MRYVGVMVQSFMLLSVFIYIYMCARMDSTSTHHPAAGPLTSLRSCGFGVHVVRPAGLLLFAFVWWSAPSAGTNKQINRKRDGASVAWGGGSFRRKFVACMHLDPRTLP